MIVINYLFFSRPSIDNIHRKIKNKLKQYYQLYKLALSLSFF
jgi:hypothetical protein